MIFYMDIILILFGITIILVSFPVGNYMVKLNSSIDNTGSVLFLLEMALLGAGLTLSVIIRLVFKRRYL